MQQFAIDHPTISAVCICVTSLLLSALIGFGIWLTTPDRKLDTTEQE